MNGNLNQARPPCTPHRRGVLTAANLAILEQAYENQVEFVSVLVDENTALRAEIDRLRGGGGRLDQSTHVEALRGQLENINRLVATLERELDTERTEVQRLHGLLSQVPLQPAQPAPTQAKEPERYSWWLDRFDNLEVDEVHGKRV